MEAFSDRAPAAAPPRTATVLVFLAAFAIILSYLGAYAVTNALVSADVIPPWPRDDDPRPRWMLWMFSGLFAGFTLLGLLLGWTTHRQLNRLDALADEDE